MSGQDQGILEALALNEDKISKLYELYAGIYEKYYGFWYMLSSDELSHAAWLRSLDRSYRNGTLVVNEKRFNITAVKLFGDYLDQKAVEVQNNELPMEKALVIALDIENSLIEKSWFTMLESALTEDKLMLQRLPRH